MPETENWAPGKWNVKEGIFSDLSGGNLQENLKIMNLLLEGDAPKSLKTTVLMNAATAFWVQGNVLRWKRAWNSLNLF